MYIHISHRHGLVAKLFDGVSCSHSADEALAQLEAAVANSVTVVIASVMEDKLPSYQAAQQDTEGESGGETILFLALG